MQASTWVKPREYPQLLISFASISFIARGWTFGADLSYLMLRQWKEPFSSQYLVSLQQYLWPRSAFTTTWINHPEIRNRGRIWLTVDTFTVCYFKCLRRKAHEIARIYFIWVRYEKLLVVVFWGPSKHYLQSNSHRLETMQLQYKQLLMLAIIYDIYPTAKNVSSFGYRCSPNSCTDLNKFESAI